MIDRNNDRCSYIVIPEELTVDKCDDYKAMKLQFVFCDNIPEFYGFLEKGTFRFGIDRTTSFLDDIESKWNWLLFQACFHFGMEYRYLLNDYVRTIDKGLEINWLRIFEKSIIDTCIRQYTLHPVENFDDVLKIGITEYLVNREVLLKNAFAYRRPSVPVANRAFSMKEVATQSNWITVDDEIMKLEKDLSRHEERLKGEQYERAK